MKHKKGLIILIIIALISVIFGTKSIISKLTNKNSFTFNFSYPNSDEEFDEDFDDEFEDESTDTLGKIISLKFNKDFNEPA